MPVRFAALPFAFLLSSFVLSACGFRLQGAPQLDAAFARTLIVVPVEEPLLRRQLAERIELTGSQVVDDPSRASAEVRVTAAHTDQRVLSISAQGRPLEYEIAYQVRFEVRVGQRVVLPTQTLELRRDYPFDTTDVLARQREAGVLLDAMQREMAALILRRLAAVAPPPAPR
jgi:LPS-assembly lipoprotein